MELHKESRLLMNKLCLLLFLSISGLPVFAKPPASAQQIAEHDPLRCWWRTSSGAVRIGETFDLTLTCAALDSEAIQVIPDESRLAGSAIALAPFEIVGSTHPRDLHNGQRRFFQYGYTLRIINPDAIGNNVPLPPLTLNYRIDSRVAGDASVQGRALSYLLPPLSVRVLSLVAADAPGIRDTSAGNFSAIEALMQRAGMLDIAAFSLAALGLLVLVALLMRLITHARKTASHTTRLLGTRQVLELAAHELTAVARDANPGWNHELVGRAQAATRIAAACALGHPINQAAASHDAQTGQGGLVVKTGFAHRQPIMLSAAATGSLLAQAIAHLPPSSPAQSRRPTLEQLQTALTTFDRTQYGAQDVLERTALDAALDATLAAAFAITTRLKSTQARDTSWRRRWLPWPGAKAQA
jgi:hypothetical protein